MQNAIDLEDTKLGGRGDVSCMNLVHREVLDVHHELLLDNMEPWEVARELMGEGAISSFHYRQLKAVAGEGNRAVCSLLLAFLWRLGSRGYVPLVSALHRTGQYALAFTLSKTEIEIRRLFPPFRPAQVADSSKQPPQSVATAWAIDAAPSSATAMAPSPSLRSELSFTAGSEAPRSADLEPSFATDLVPARATGSEPPLAANKVPSHAPKKAKRAATKKQAASAAQTDISLPAQADVSFPTETDVSPPTAPRKIAQPPYEGAQPLKEMLKNSTTETQTSITWPPDEDVMGPSAKPDYLVIETQTSFVSVNGGEASDTTQKVSQGAQPPQEKPETSTIATQTGVTCPPGEDVSAKPVKTQISVISVDGGDASDTTQKVSQGAQPPQEKPETSTIATQTGVTCPPGEDVSAKPVETQTSVISVDGGDASDTRRLSQKSEESSEKEEGSRGSKQNLDRKGLGKRLDALEEVGERRIWELERRVEVLERAAFSEDAPTPSESGSGWN